MVSLKLLVSFMVTSISAVQAVTKEDPDCFTKCAIKITSVDGYEKDCVNFAHMHGNTQAAARYHGSVPDKYEDICEDLIDFANACYCLPSLVKERPDEDDKHGWWKPKNDEKNKAEHYKEKKPKLNNEDRAEAFKLKKPKFNDDDKTENSKEKKPKFDDQGKAAYWEGRRPKKIFPEDKVDEYEEYRARYYNKKKPGYLKGKDCGCDKDCPKEKSASDKKEGTEEDNSRKNQELDQVATAETPTPTSTIGTGEFRVVAQTVTEQQTETATTTAFATTTITNSTTVTATGFTTLTTTTTTIPTGTASTLPFILGDPATCNAPGSCRLPSSPCGPSGSPCSCWATSEGDSLCMVETNCTGLQQCSSSSNCPAGQKCFINTCCSRGGVCIAPATNEQCGITASQ